MSKYALNQSVLVVNGKYRGMAGAVICCDDVIKKVKIQIEGVKNNASVNLFLVLNFNQVRAL